MTTENWIQLFVPTISIVVAIISAGLSYYFAKKKQILSDEKRLKETYYLKYIEALSDIVVSVNDDVRDRYSDAQNQLLLIGSAEVVTAVMDFHNYVKPSSNRNFDIDKHDELLTKILKSMRVDLYDNKNINSGYPIVHLTGKVPSDK